MTTSFFAVFTPSLVMTAIVGAFMSLTWRAMRATPALVAYWLCALLVHLGWLAIPALGGLAPILRWLAIMWLGGMLAAMVLLIPFALLAIGFGLLRRRGPSVLLPTGYVACFVLSGIILAFTSTADFVVREEDLRISNLPAGLDGLRIANLGDVHLGRFIDAKELRRGVEEINRRHVDLIAITGDLVDDTGQLEDGMRALELADAPSGLVAILGNHEEMGDLARILSIYREHQKRIRLLVDENTAIARRGATLHIVGVDYPLSALGGPLMSYREQTAAMTQQADQGFEGLTAGDTIVALTHQPAFFRFAAAHGAQLTLASHTHGGQLRLFGRPVIDLFPYLQGTYRLNDAQLDVSAGFGHWLPIRFGVPREIVIVTLHHD
jgi:uncharacterized protein